MKQVVFLSLLLAFSASAWGERLDDFEAKLSIGYDNNGFQALDESQSSRMTRLYTRAVMTLLKNQRLSIRSKFSDGLKHVSASDATIAVNALELNSLFRLTKAIHIHLDADVKHKAIYGEFLSDETGYFHHEGEIAVRFVKWPFLQPTISVLNRSLNVADADGLDFTSDGFKLKVQAQKSSLRVGIELERLFPSFEGDAPYETQNRLKAELYFISPVTLAASYALWRYNASVQPGRLHRFALLMIKPTPYQTTLTFYGLKQFGQVPVFRDVLPSEPDELENNASLWVLKLSKQFPLGLDLELRYNYLQGGTSPDVNTFTLSAGYTFDRFSPR